MWQCKATDRVEPSSNFVILKRNRENSKQSSKACYDPTGSHELGTAESSHKNGARNLLCSRARTRSGIEGTSATHYRNPRCAFFLKAEAVVSHVLHLHRSCIIHLQSYLLLHFFLYLKSFDPNPRFWQVAPGCVDYTNRGACLRHIHATHYY